MRAMTKVGPRQVANGGRMSKALARRHGGSRLDEKRRARRVWRGPWRRGPAGRDELGQALAIVLGLVLFMVSVPVALDLMAIDRPAVTGNAQNGQSALQAAQAGIADFQNHLVSDPSYASLTPSQGFCSTAGNPNPPVSPPAPTCAGQTDPNDPAFVETFAASCATSGANDTSWDTTSGTASSYNTGFQYVVDATHVADLSNPVAYVYATGRAGRSGNYACRSVKAAFQTLNGSDTAEPSPSSQTNAVTPPTVTSPVSMTLGGATGSNGSTCPFLCWIAEFFGVDRPGSGGVGMQISLKFTAPPNIFFSSAKGAARHARHARRRCDVGQRRLNELERRGRRQVWRRRWRGHRGVRGAERRNAVRADDAGLPISGHGLREPPERCRFSGGLRRGGGRRWRWGRWGLLLQLHERGRRRRRERRRTGGLLRNERERHLGRE